jgi:hypothetical protein
MSYIILDPASGGVDAQQFDTDAGSAVPVAGIVNILGGTSITTAGAGNTVTVNLDVPIPVTSGGTGLASLTDNAVLVGSGAADVTPIAVGTDGQVLIGATGADPAFATLTSASGTISFVAGPNTLNLETSGTEVYNVTQVDDTDSPYTLLSSDHYISCDVSLGVLTINLPNAPATGRVYTIKDMGGDAATNNITVTTVGGVVTIDGATTFVINSAYQAISVIFNGTSYEVF